MTTESHDIHPALSRVRELLGGRAIELGLLEPEAAAAAVVAGIEALLDREVHTPEPTEEECSRIYALHPERFSSGELVHARHILFAITPGAPLEAIRAQAEQTLLELQVSPDRFAELAAERSNCPSGQRAGNLGQLSRGECVPEFEQAVFDAKTTGLLPRLVKTRFGFHIVAVDRRIPGALVPYELVRAQIADWLRGRVLEKALEQYVQVLAGRAGVQLPGIGAAATPLVQ